MEGVEVELVSAEFGIGAVKCGLLMRKDQSERGRMHAGRADLGV